MNNGRANSDPKLHERILSLRQNLTRQHRKLANYLLSNGDNSCFLNARGLAQAASVSPATVIRFSHKLGFDGFQSLKSVLQEKVREQLSTGERLSNVIRLAKKNDILRQKAEVDTTSIQNTVHMTRAQHFDRAIDSITKAGTIYLLGQKSSFALAYFIHFRLSRMGINCKLLNLGGPLGLSELAPLGRKDILLAFAFRSAPQEVRLAIKTARAKKAKVIVITSPFASHLGDQAHVHLQVDLGSQEKSQSFTGVLTLCHALMIGVAARMGKRSTKRLNEIEVLEKSLVS